ncbi:hypothetical protein [Massilia rubra]|uniref:Uncharacterized protein n=1 Tax=Massilia rubra TaxID=2607910 RepID=A0ABX0LZC9_9BURK|nr:hypothetical protein [Massilia rubra]NHZ37471.1 hypothetical protein [Massilia rubra]
MVTPSVFSLLLPHPHDTLAALAYASYKHHEMQTYAAIEAQTGHPPTPEDVDTFERAATTPVCLAMYHRQADSFMNAFVNATLDAKREALHADFTSTAIGRQLAAIQAELRARRGPLGLFRDVGANLSVNVLTILLIAALVFGYRLLDDGLDRLSFRTGVTQATPRPSLDEENRH